VQLLVTEAQPLHRECERRRGDALHPEDLLVERDGLVEVVGMHADVIDRGRGHGGSFLGRC
jgi:hypothetical protein